MAELSSSGSAPLSWELDCKDKGVRVYVNGTEIPTTDVKTYEDSNGPAHINRHSEVSFPAEWQSQSVIDVFESFGDNDNTYDRVRVDWQHPSTGEWTTKHYGYASQIGGTDTTGVLKAFVSDPSQLLSEIPFSNTYDNITSYGAVLKDVVEAFEANTPFTGVEYAGGHQFTIPEDEYSVDGIGGELLDIVEDSSSGPPVKQTFQSNRHTLVDVMDWITSARGGFWYFRLVGDTLVLVHDDEMGHTSHVSTEVDGYDGNSVDVIENTALQQLAPINAVTVKGRSNVSMHGFEVKEISSETIPYATAYYPPYVERNDGIRRPPEIESNAVTIETVEKQAKNHLISRIEQSGTGEITLYGEPALSPRDRVVAIPECGDLVQSVTPVSYNAKRVTHHKPATGPYRTSLTVSPYVDTDKIVVESGVNPTNLDGLDPISDT